MTDPDGKLVQARDTVQTLRAAIANLEPTDLIDIPGSPSTEAAVSGTSTPPTPWRGDSTLTSHLLGALNATHWAAMALLATDVDDPLPFIVAPERDRTVLPPLPEITAHLDAVDASLAQLQRARTPDEHDAIDTACTIIINDDALTQPHCRQPDCADPRRVHARWRGLSEGGPRLCNRCGGEALHGRWCPRCWHAAVAEAADEDRHAQRTRELAEDVHTSPCANPRQRRTIDIDGIGCTGVGQHQVEVGGLRIPLCRSCRQAEKDLRRNRTPELADIAPHTAATAHTLTCPACDWLTVITQQGQPCDHCGAATYAA